MNPYENMPEHVQRAVDRARTMNRTAARTMKAARLAAGFETVDRARRAGEGWGAVMKTEDSIVAALAFAALLYACIAKALRWI